MTNPPRPLPWFVLLSLLLGLSTSARAPAPWQVWTCDLAGCAPGLAVRWTPAPPPPCPPLTFPADWELQASLYTDVTGDRFPECVLLVWRPWRDWPIMRWAKGPSPIAANHDAAGYSAHVILVTPQGGGEYRELWAGSALAVPVLQLAVGNVDGNEKPELIVLEGTYSAGRSGPARQLAVWWWNGFGFNLRWRSPPGRFTALTLADLNGDQVQEILVQ